MYTLGLAVEQGAVHVHVIGISVVMNFAVIWVSLRGEQLSSNNCRSFPVMPICVG